MTPARIKEIRSITGLSQGELAQLVGTSCMTINRWERGKPLSSNGEAWLLAIAMALDRGGKELAGKIRNRLLVAGRFQALYVILHELYGEPNE